MENEVRKVAKDGERWLDYVLLSGFPAGFKSSMVFGLSNWKNGVVIY